MGACIVDIIYMPDRHMLYTPLVDGPVVGAEGPDLAADFEHGQNLVELADIELALFKQLITVGDAL